MGLQKTVQADFFQPIGDSPAIGIGQCVRNLVNDHLPGSFGVWPGQAAHPFAMDVGG